MSQNYAMPPLTPEEAQQVIDMCESTLAMHAPHTIHAKQAQITLAALTAEPEVWIKPDSLGFPRLAGIDAVTIPYVPEYPIPLYTAPPAPVLRQYKAVAEALEGLLWPNMPIGNKAVIKAAIDALNGSSSTGGQQ